MDEILLFLLKKKAYAQPAAVTTVELGEALHMSQQNASRRLMLLEKEGHLKRTREGIKLTKKARCEMLELYGSLKTAFDQGEFEITGTVVSGTGDGRRYLGLEEYKRQIKNKLGFEPYPGTLNLEIAGKGKRERLLQLEPIVITGFRKKEKTYGDLFAYRCKVEGHECAIILPLRTHHGPELIELVCPFSIRKRLGKKDGDKLKVTVW